MLGSRTKITLTFEIKIWGGGGGGGGGRNMRHGIKKVVFTLLFDRGPLLETLNLVLNPDIRNTPTIL